jgi:hypothetical protein
VDELERVAERGGIRDVRVTALVLVGGRGIQRIGDVPDLRLAAACSHGDLLRQEGLDVMARLEGAELAEARVRAERLLLDRRLGRRVIGHGDDRDLAMGPEARRLLAGVHAGRRLARPQRI